MILIPLHSSVELLIAEGAETTASPSAITGMTKTTVR